MARTQFPLIGGLFNTLVLKNMSLTKDGCDHEYAQGLQRVCIKDRSHWAVLQLNKSGTYLYNLVFFIGECRDFRASNSASENKKKYSKD